MPKVSKIYMRTNILPAEYQEVEYIQSSGTQYFTVGNSFKTSYKVVIDFQMTVTGGDYVPVGIHYSGGGNNIKYGVNAYSSYFKVNAGGTAWTNTISENTDRHTITINKSAVIVDGTSYTTNYVDYTFSQGIGVFCYNEYYLSPQYTCKSSNKLYKLDLYDENGNHINDLVPCYRKSDSVIGMYDLVNDTFYTNSGTGTFTKGNDTPNMVEHLVRPVSSEITETYTVVNTSNTTNSQSIYKAGYKIKSITWSTTASNSATWANYDMRIRNGTSGGNWFVWWSWIGGNETSSKTYKLSVAQNSSETDLWTSPGYGYAYTTINIVNTINSDGTWTSQYGEHSNSGDFSSNSTAMSVLNGLFTGSDTVGYFRTNNSGAHLDNNTITVTYEPV